MEGDDCSFKQDASLRTAVSERKPEVRGSKPGRCVLETGLVLPGAAVERAECGAGSEQTAGRR